LPPFWRAEEKEYEEEVCMITRCENIEVNYTDLQESVRVAWAALKKQPFEPRIDATCIVDGCSGKPSAARVV
jgi:hypothetical protein